MNIKLRERIKLGKNKRKRKKEKFPIEEWEKAKTKEGKKIPDQRSEENKRNIQKGLWTRRHLNKYRVITKVNMKRKETTT